MNSFDEVFALVKRYCLEKGNIPEVAVKLWIDALTPVHLDGTTALFTVQSEFQRDVILNNYESLLKEAFLSTLGFEIHLEIQVEESGAQPSLDPQKSQNYDEIVRRHEELEHSFEGANYEYTFSTFIVGGSNEFAYAACTAVAKDPVGVFPIGTSDSTNPGYAPRKNKRPQTNGVVVRLRSVAQSCSAPCSSAS